MEINIENNRIGFIFKNAKLSLFNKVLESVLYYTVWSCTLLSLLTLKIGGCKFAKTQHMKIMLSAFGNILIVNFDNIRYTLIRCTIVSM